MGVTIAKGHIVKFLVEERILNRVYIMVFSFFYEMAELSKKNLGMLRQVLESGRITNKG